MKLAVMAAGAVGGYFGARFAAAGEDVQLIARGAQLAALKRNGLKLESALGDLVLNDLSVHDSPAAIGPVDVVLFTVKLWDTETAGAVCCPLIGPDTCVISLQNGIDSSARLRPLLGESHVVGGVAYISAVISEPGVIRHNSSFARLHFGERDGRPSPRLKAFEAACAKADVDARLSADVEKDQWEKFVFLVGLSGTTALTRSPIGPILADRDCRALFLELMEEVVAVGRARDVNLDERYAEDRLRFVETLPAGMKASMLEDLERGNRLELEWLSGTVVGLGRELGIATPANAAVYAGLKLHANGLR
jgi:2-dehydropantoate 2-reductase